MGVQWRSQNFFSLRQRTTVRSCRARAGGNLLLSIVTLLTSGTERATVGVLPSSLLAASCHRDFRHVCGFYVRPRLHDSKISYEAVASVTLMVATPLVWLLGVVLRRYIDFLILLIPTPLVSVLFCSSIPTFFCSFLKIFFVLVPVLF